MPQLAAGGARRSGSHTWMASLHVHAVYDPPQKLLNRHNEIHVPVARKSSTVAAA